MKYAEPNMKKDLVFLEPKENILSKVESVRYVLFAKEIKNQCFICFYSYIANQLILYETNLLLLQDCGRLE